MTRTTTTRGTELVPHTESVPIVSGEQMRDAVAKAIRPYTSGQIARITGRSKDTVKSWREESNRCPQADAVANLCRGLPSVRAALAERFGFDKAAHSGSNDAINSIVRRIALGEGPEAAFCRWVIRQAEHPEKPEPIPGVVLDAWRLQELREQRAREDEERKSGAVRDLFAPERRRA